MRTISRFLKDETAATAIEYGLIAAGIANRRQRRRLRAQHEVRGHQHVAEIDWPSRLLSRDRHQPAFRDHRRGVR